MEKLIFFGLVIPIFIFVLYLGGRAIMTGFGAKSTNKSNLFELFALDPVLIALTPK